MRRTMQIGRLSQRVTIYTFIEAEDEMGQSSQQLSPVATVWCDIRPIRGNEFYELKKIQSKVTHRCYIRYQDIFADMNSNWYLELDGKVFDIDSVFDVDYEHKMLEIRCYERVNKEGHDIEEPPTPTPTPDPDPVEPSGEDTPTEPTEDPVEPGGNEEEQTDG